MKKKQKKKHYGLVRKLLWILWTPLLLVGLILVAVLGVFLAGLYSVEYEKDEYIVASSGYEDLDTFYLNDSYRLVVTDSECLPIAEKFNGYIERILGTPFTVVSVKGSEPYIELLVQADLDCDYRFSSDNVNITVAANDKDHLLRGSYAFLEEFGGIRCYTKDLIAATSDKIFFPKKTGGYTQEYCDYFEMRDTDWISAKDDEYSWFRGYNTDEYRYQIYNQQSTETKEQAETRIADQYAYYTSLGGRSQYISDFCHTFSSQFLSASKYYDKGLNLECYALDADGNRRRDELCLSNSKTLEIVKQEVFDLLENKHDDDNAYGVFYDRNAPLQIISLTQSDDLTACKCKDCVSYAKAHGGYSATNLRFVNQIAQAVKDAGYDNVAFDTFAYRYTRSAPTDIVPLENVIIRLCTIECCSSHYIDDEDCLANKAFMKDLADWSKICDRIYIWDYCTDFSYFMTPFPNLNVLAHNIRVYYEHNVKGVYEEGNYTLEKDGVDPEFGELRSYLISKVMQNPYCDYQAVMQEFCNAYYGAGGEDMYAFITKADTYAGRKHLNIYKHPTLILDCSQEERNELNELFEHAKSVATGTALEHVKSTELSWRYYKMVNRLFEFSDITQYDVLQEHLIIDIYTQTKGSRFHEVESNCFTAGILQTAIIDLRPLFDLVVGNFIYGP